MIRRGVFGLLFALISFIVNAQGVPFVIDNSFVPTLSFLQNGWCGTYDGVEPASGMYLTIKRALVLNKDMTFTNDMKVNSNSLSEIILKHEEGKYNYDEETRRIVYISTYDSVLDIRTYVQSSIIRYQVARHNETENIVQVAEPVQFTLPTPDGTRQWVMFDPTLMSPVDPSKQAVYVMSRTEGTANGIIFLNNEKGNGLPTRIYNCQGRQAEKPIKGIWVIDGKKVICK